MYKAASRSMIRATRVDRPHPTRGSLEPTSVAAVPLHLLSLKQATEERTELNRQMAADNNAMIVAKREGDRQQIALLGHRIQATGQRLNALKAHIHDATMSLNARLEGKWFAQAVNELLTPEQAQAIFARVEEKRRQAVAMDA